MDLFSLKNWQKIVIILLLLGVLMLAIGGYLQPVIKTALNPVVKVQEWFYDRYQGIRVMLNASSDLVMLQQQNSELEQENATLRSQIVGLSTTSDRSRNSLCFIGLCKSTTPK